jgi:hypothetical protein
MFRLLLFAIFAFFFYLIFWFDKRPAEYPPKVDTRGASSMLCATLTRRVSQTLEGFKDGGSNVRILSSVEMRELICVRNSIDDYYDSFSALDLRARGVSSLSEYLKRIESSCILRKHDLDNAESTIRQCIKQVDWEKVIEDRMGNNSWIDMGRLCALPWKIGLTEGKTYEYGLPHTRGDIIIIPVSHCGKGSKAEDELLDTLMHEQLHVYQKMYPEDFQKYLDSEGFVRHCKRKDIQNVAANPDADEWVYSKDGEIFVGQYSGSDSVGRRAPFGANYKSVTFKPMNHPRFDCPQEYAVY